MLKIIGAGLTLCLVSTVINTAVTATVEFSHNITMADSPQVAVPLYWVIVVDLLNGLGAGVTMIYTVEFVMAQTPNRMRGIMMGLMLIMFGCSFSHVLLLLVKVSLVMFLHYGLYVDVPLPLSQLVSLGSNNKYYQHQHCHWR